MPTFDASAVTRFSTEGEGAFASDHPCVLNRVSITVTSGNNLILLPEDVLSIRRVTWKGYKLDPLSHRNFRETFQSATQQGKPFWYVFNSVEQNYLQLFPIPNESLPLGSPLFDDQLGLFDDMGGLFDSITGANTGSDLFGSNIPNCCIVEYWQSPDSVSTFIPAYFRRRLLKNYILHGCFNIEGQLQDLKASKYYKDRWDGLSKLYGQLLDDLHSKPRKLVISGISSSYFYPGHPILPIAKYGIGVDKGE